MKDWLTKRITVEEAEAKHLITDDRLGAAPIPFGFINSQWEKIKSSLIEGDELWEFCSPIETWENLMGCQGICLVRNEEIIMEIITQMN